MISVDDKKITLIIKGEWTSNKKPEDVTDLYEFLQNLDVSHWWFEEGD